MIIEIENDSVLNSQADLLVNPVNCMGVMGAGLAKAIADKYPIILHPYKQACASKALRIGTVFVTPVGKDGPPYYVANLPTKRHWKDRSYLEDVERGLQALVQWMVPYKDERDCHVRSVAVPALGCGLGGLDWDDVSPILYKELGPLQNVIVYLYPPLDS
jgi:O-acetyl-ADP-ribose deacetylase (regulator of RNase III)